jgi:hypothetical protein
VTVSSHVAAAIIRWVNPCINGFLDVTNTGERRISSSDNGFLMWGSSPLSCLNSGGSIVVIPTGMIFSFDVCII